MMEVGLEALKDRLGDYVKRARKGERILITEGGRSVALLIPIEASEAARRAWDLVATGAANWSGGKPAGSHPWPRARVGSASAFVLEDRR
jgi:prevent-host-death family protein